MGTSHLYWILTGPSFAVQELLSWKPMQMPAAIFLNFHSSNDHHSNMHGMQIAGSVFQGTHALSPVFTVSCLRRKISPYFNTCMGPRNRFQGMNSASICRLAGRYDNPFPPRFLAPIDSFKNSSRVKTVYTNVSVSVHNDCHNTGLCHLDNDDQMAYALYILILLGYSSEKFFAQSCLIQSAFKMGT